MLSYRGGLWVAGLRLSCPCLHLWTWTSQDMEIKRLEGTVHLQCEERTSMLERIASLQASSPEFSTADGPNGGPQMQPEVPSGPEAAYRAGLSGRGKGGGGRRNKKSTF